MKTKIFITIASSFFIFHSAFGQGTLAPPGAPAATMKTLSQVEPRIPILSSAPFTIIAPGSYYLTTNVSTSVSNAIVIVANSVTLDLGGFTISSTVANAANGGSAIFLSTGLSDIAIFNGHISGGVTNNGKQQYFGPGFGYGIYFWGTAPVNTRVSGVSVTGCLYHGIFLLAGDSSLVESCTVRTIGSYGIYASSVKDSVAVDCGDAAVVGDEISHCRGESTGNGSGIDALSSAVNCYGHSSGNAAGVFAYAAQNCYGTSVLGNGLSATTAQNCYGYCLSGNGVGLSATVAQNCYGASSNGTGLYASTAQNCFGDSLGAGNGLTASYLATGCVGASATGIGLSANNASFCSGSRPGGTAILATIATGCIANYGTNLITYKYNMP